MRLEHTKSCILVANPVNSPVSLLFYTWHGLNGIEQVVPAGNHNKQRIKKETSAPVSYGICQGCVLKPNHSCTRDFICQTVNKISVLTRLIMLSLIMLLNVRKLNIYGVAQTCDCFMPVATSQLTTCLLTGIKPLTLSSHL